MMIANTEVSMRGIGLVAANRRESDRVPGPFDAWRVGFLETPVRIYDISHGGCFVHAMHEQEQGVIVMLKIQLPDGGWIEFKAETLYRRPGFGFAVRFIDMDHQTRARLDRALQVLAANSSAVLTHAGFPPASPETQPRRPPAGPLGQPTRQTAPLQVTGLRLSDRSGGSTGPRGRRPRHTPATGLPGTTVR